MCTAPFSGRWAPGCWRPFASTSPFNQPIAGDVQVHPNSSAIVQRVLQFGLPANLSAGGDPQYDWSHPIYWARDTDPVFTLHETASWGTNELEGMRIRVPDAARAAGGSDGHMAIIQPDGWEYDLWQVQSKPAGGGTLSFSWGGRTRIDGDGRGGGATAAGFGLSAGIIRQEELVAGHINHALMLTLKCTSNDTSFGFGVQPHRAGDNGGSFVYPAGHGDARCNDGTDSSLPPMGARFQLAMTDSQIAALAVPDWKKTVLRAMAHYGMYVGDTGGAGVGLQFESGASYTSFGHEDPLVTFGREQGLPQWNGAYVYNMAQGVDWARYLRVVAPPAH